ncbi:MAG: ATP-binding cassette domain-containing protein [Bryobacteraceae bacterium]|nr:ATP-binding cassette domain-containing protein [Bryobacteraceae bacterium]
MIRVHSLAKTFRDPKRGTVMAVDHISFEARPGEIFGLLGSNGAGKTTTMRMLATILQPTDGTAEVAGFDIRRSPADVRRSIGFLSGDMGYYRRLSPREVLQIFGTINGVEPRALKTRIDMLIEQFGMKEFADGRAESFSTGMRQRANIARVLVHDPPVLILDEPTTGLDVPTAQVIEKFILSAKENGKCVVLSTHIMEEAEYLCDRIAVVHGGKLQALGTMDQLRQRTGKQRLREIFLELINLPAEGEVTA